MTRWPGGVLVAVIGLTMGCASPTPATQPDQAMPDLGTDAPDLEVEPDPGPGVDLATGDLAVAGGGDLAGGDLAMPPTCTPGAACTTSSPGACAPGHVVCTSGVAGCMADAQPAARENCFNDADDDCDGKVNNGCPDQLVVGATRALTAHGGTGGSPKSALCPAGTWLLKTSMYWDDKDKFVGGLDVWCAAPALVRGASSYSVASGPLPATPSASALGKNAGNGSGFVDFTCAAGGDVGQWSGGRSGGFVSAFGMYCSSATLSLASDNQLTLTMLPVGTNSPLGYDHMDPLFQDLCAPNEVLVGYNVRAGDYLDQVQAVCALVSVTYK